jgi:dolichol kinase
MVFLAVGDLAAAVFGESFGKINILGRSLEGFIVSFIVSLIVGLIYFKYFSFINLSFKIILWGSLTSSIIGHISTPVLKINDNLTIPVISGLVMTLVL